MPDLPEIPPAFLDPSSPLSYNGKIAKAKSLLDFWAWSGSDLINNINRGVFAEYVVALACDITKKPRVAWDAYDLDFEGIKLEVKSSAYIQAWKQESYSTPNFGIAPSKAYDYSTNKLENEKKRQADVYVFCLLEHREQKTLDPLNLNQWLFYICSTERLNKYSLTANSITLKKLKDIGAVACRYPRIKRYIREEFEIKLSRK